MPLPLADALSSATLVITGITLALVIATFLFVLGNRASTEQARDDLMAQLEILRAQFQAAHRPILIDALPSTVEVAIEAGKVRLSVPLRNAGSGLAVVDADGLAIEGTGIGRLESRAVQRSHVPVNETTRIELVADHRMHGLDQPPQAAWELTVPYADIAGGQRTVASVLVVCRGDDIHGPWHVERVEQQALDRVPSEHVQPGADAERPAAERPAAARGPEQAAPVADSATKGGPSRQPVTDIWGNPLDKRSRRRR